MVSPPVSLELRNITNSACSSSDIFEMSKSVFPLNLTGVAIELARPWAGRGGLEGVAEWREGVAEWREGVVEWREGVVEWREGVVLDGTG